MLKVTRKKSAELRMQRTCEASDGTAACARQRASATWNQRNRSRTSTYASQPHTTNSSHTYINTNSSTKFL